MPSKSEKNPYVIKHWSDGDKPREKLLNKGTSSLSDSELIAILIGSGRPKLNALELAKNMLASVNNNLSELAKVSAKDLMKMRGIGKAKAIAIVAALEIGRRRNGFDLDEKPRADHSADAFAYIRGDLMDLHHEEFWVLMINRGGRIIKKKKISEGGVHGTVADPRIIFKMAVEELASGVILVHNHPSGNLTPSQCDKDLTRKIKGAGKMLDITLLDHLIIANQKYFSFADEGLL